MTVEKTPANQSLISAAPELLSACKAFLALFRGADMRPEDECYEIADIMEKAIDKAEEETIMKNTVITGFSNPTKEGINLHLNNPTTLKGRKMQSKEFYVSWDRIGKALFDNYCDDLNELRKLRKEVEND